MFTTILVIIAWIASAFLRNRFRHEFVINEGFTGLLYQHGELRWTLPAGRAVRWGRNFRLAVIDMRKTLLQVPGQEVLTSDNVGVKMSVVLTIQIVDAVKSAQTTDNHLAHIYSAAQTAVRAAVVSTGMDALLGQRVSIGAQLREMIAPQAEALGVQLHSVEVRDVMLPADLRKAFSETLKARQESLAGLERARGETAALRSLANAARVVEAQPAVATLRFFQTLEASKQAIVLNDLSILTGMRSEKKN